MAWNNNNPAQPTVTINHHTNGGKYSAKQWEEHLTQINDDIKLNVMIFLRDEKAKSNKEAKAIVKRINNKIEKLSKEQYGEDIIVPPREVGTTIKHNGIRVNFTEKFLYTDLINYRVKSINVKADKEIPGPYLSKYAQFSNLAFHIRKTKEYKSKSPSRKTGCI